MTCPLTLLSVYLSVYKELVVRLLIIFLGLVIAVGGCSYVNRHLLVEDDHIFEELSEEAFEEYTGIQLDFTPLSPEK